MTNYRYLERFDKLLLDLLANNPAMNTSTNPGNKRKGGDGDDSLNKSGDGTLTQTRSKNRTLFSKSMIGKHLLNPESDQLLEETSEEEILSGTGVGVESFGVSPVVVGDNCPRHFNRENQNNGDKIQVEKTTDDAEARDEVEVSTADNVSTDKDDNEQYELAESSVDNGFEADDTATIDIEIIAADEEETEDDIFSDAFSVASVNNSKLPNCWTIPEMTLKMMKSLPNPRTLLSRRSQLNRRKVNLPKVKHLNRLQPNDPPQVPQPPPHTVLYTPPLLHNLPAGHN